MIHHKHISAYPNKIKYQSSSPGWLLSNSLTVSLALPPYVLLSCLSLPSSNPSSSSTGIREYEFWINNYQMTIYYIWSWSKTTATTKQEPRVKQEPDGFEYNRNIVGCSWQQRKSHASHCLSNGDKMVARENEVDWAAVSTYHFFPSLTPDYRPPAELPVRNMRK